MKKNVILVAVLVLLAAVYVIFFTNWFRSTPIFISNTVRPVGRDGEPLLIFALGKEYKLTEIKVVPLGEWQTNQMAQPLWHLVSPGTRPLKMFSYGQHVRGMEPAVAGSQPSPLQPNVVYRIFVSAGATKGSHDFKVAGDIGGTPSGGRF